MDPLEPLPPVSTWEREQQTSARVERTGEHADQERQQPQRQHPDRRDDDAVLVELDHSPDEGADNGALRPDDGANHIDIEV